jgi:pyruvate dehydrogenase E2 component (dihydrolipoamide acetyltransferase)
LKAEGDTIKRGEPLYELDTDKVTQEVEAEEDGVLLRITVGQGEVPVGQTIAVIGMQGEVVTVTDPSESAPPQADDARRNIETSTRAPIVEASAPPEREQGQRLQRDPPEESVGIRASPRARSIARELGIQLDELVGSGPQGRIIAEDVERAAAFRPGADLGPSIETEIVALTGLRRTIARRLTDAWQIPVFQLTVSADMTRADKLVKVLREQNAGLHITITDVLSKVCAQALVLHGGLNVQFGDDALRFSSTVNIGLAVAAPQGLVVVVLPSAERLSLVELARFRGTIVERARDNKLARADLEGGTFTISNLGMFDIERFVAVINPPQAAILAVGATESRPVGRAGEIVLRPMMTMTLTVDHRAVDGAQAAAFLTTVKTFLEEPALAL